MQPIPKEMKRYYKALFSTKPKAVNLYKLEKICKNGEKVAVPGKVLGMGKLTKSLTVYALKFSNSALKSIISAGGKALSIDELIKKKERAKIIR